MDMSNIEDDVYEIKKLKIFLIFYKTHGWISNIDRTIDVDKSIQAIENILADREKMLKERDVANDSIIAHKFAVMQQQIEQKDKRIQELEEENAELLELKISVSSMNTIQNLEKEKIKLEERCFIAEGNLKTTKKELRDYFYNSIPKQTVIDKIEELKKQISIDICIENNLEKHYELKYKIEVLQELLEGDK